MGEAKARSDLEKLRMRLNPPPPPVCCGCQRPVTSQMMRAHLAIMTGPDKWLCHMCEGGWGDVDVDGYPDVDKFVS